MTNDPTPMPPRRPEDGLFALLEAELWANVPSLSPIARKQEAETLYKIFVSAVKRRDRKMLRDLETVQKELWYDDQFTEDVFVPFDNVKDVLERHKL